MIDFTIERDDPVSGTAIEALRLAVGWDEEAGKYDQVLTNAWMHLTVRDRGRLIGYVNVISDGISNALIADLMVQPSFQRRGIGTAIVRRAVSAAGRRRLGCNTIEHRRPRPDFGAPPTADLLLAQGCW